MVQEVGEDNVSGELVEIYAEIRGLYGVPYVSAIYRVLATRPDFLRWAWHAVGPGLRAGYVQQAGWQCSADLVFPPLDPIPPAAIAAWGLDDRDLVQIRAVAENFIRVAPVNMMVGALVARLLAGEQPGVAPDEYTSAWSPPTSLPELPAMIPFGRPDQSEHELLKVFATDMDGRPFVPGLYCMLANWPALLAHFAAVLAPRLGEPPVLRAFDDLRTAIDKTSGNVIAALPAPAGPRALPEQTDQDFFASVMTTYRRTSPEMVVAGRLIRDALPPSVAFG